MKSQAYEIFEHMDTIGPITGLIALEKYRCMRLPARIAEIKEWLKGTGVEIKDRWVTHENSYGERKRFKEYWIDWGMEGKQSRAEGAE